MKELIFSFIGSAKIGWMLRSKLSPGTRCALEHGGMAPTFLTESTDLNMLLNYWLKVVFIMLDRCAFQFKEFLSIKIFLMNF